MLKKLLTIVLPLAFPVLVYWVYLVLARRKARLKEEGRLPGWQDAPWSVIFACGVALVAVALVYGRFSDGFDPNELFMPASDGGANVDPAATAD